MIDINAEELVTLRQAARMLPKRRQDRPIHVSTLFRWVQAGVKGIKLEHVVIGGALHTSKQALQRFADALTAQRSGEAPNLNNSTTARKAHEAAVRACEEAGI